MGSITDVFILAYLYMFLHAMAFLALGLNHLSSLPPPSLSPPSLLPPPSFPPTQLSETYSKDLFVPTAADNNTLIGSAKFRSKGRLPVLSFYYAPNKVRFPLLGS